MVLAVAALCLGVFAGRPVAAQPATTPILSLEQVKADDDGNGVPNRAGDVVQVQGVVSLGMGYVPGDSAAAYVQSGDAGLLLRVIPADVPLAAGQRVAATGTVAQRAGQPFLRVERVGIMEGQAEKLSPERLGASTLDLAAYEGRRVRFAGRLVEKGSDAQGPYAVVSRSGGPVVVRPVDPVVQAGLVLQEYQVGAYVKATGVLGTQASASPAGRYVVYVQRAADIEDVLVPASYYPWALAAGALLLLGVIAAVCFQRQRMLRRLADDNYSYFFKAPTAMAVLDADLRVAEANDLLLVLTGQSRRALRRQPLSKVVRIEDETGADVAERLREAGAVTLTAHHGPAADPTTFEVHLALIEDGGRAIASFYDTTANDASLAQYESFIESLIDGCPLQVAILTPDGRYQYINSQLEPRDEVRTLLMGKSDFDYCQAYDLHMEVALRRRSRRKQAIETREVVIFDESLPERTGGERHFRRYYCPHVNEKDEVTMVIAFGVELTEQRRLSADLHEARGEAEKMTRIKEGFLQNMSHEFRTPLTGIIGFAQVLREEVPEPLVEFVDGIVLGGQRLMDTLNGMLDMAGLQAQGVEMHPEVLNLVDEVQKVVDGLHGTAREKDLFLRVQPQQPEILARLDAGLLHRVLDNVVGNALKFTETGGVVVEVAGDDRNVYVHVLDSGVGIDRDYMPDLFEAFNQEELGVDRGFEGVGLGLANTKQFVALMEGEVRVQSDKGEGSMFTLKFPNPFYRSEHEGWRRPEVLVVDRNPESHRVVRYLLDAHFRVSGAATLDEAMEKAQRTRFSALLVDAGAAPDLSPKDLLQQLRSVDGYDHVSVVAIDGKAMPGGQAPYLRAGYDRYLPKPIKKLPLLNALSDQLQPAEVVGV